MKVIALSFTLQEAGSFTTSETVYVPGLVYVTTGLILVVVVFPLPRYQTKEVLVPVGGVAFVKLTVSGVQPATVLVFMVETVMRS